MKTAIMTLAAITIAVVASIGGYRLESCIMVATAFIIHACGRDA